MVRGSMYGADQHCRGGAGRPDEPGLLWCRRVSGTVVCAVLLVQVLGCATTRDLKDYNKCLHVLHVQSDLKPR